MSRNQGVVDCNENRIVPEWKKVLEDNQAIPKNSHCKLPDSELAINTQGKPVWIC